MSQPIHEAELIAQRVLLEAASRRAAQPISVANDIKSGYTSSPITESRITPSGRLAAFSAPARTPDAVVAIKPVVNVGSLAGESHRPTRGGAAPLVNKIHSIVKKYAPKHKSPGLLAEAIVRESLKQDYDPLFVAAVIKSESAFNVAAKSNKGAQGLMQIMPATGAWLAAQENLPRGNLTSPGKNLRLGIKYLKQLENDYKGNRVYTLVAYNWGPGHLESVQKGKRRVPAESIAYAVKILSDYRRWKSGVI